MRLIRRAQTDRHPLAFVSCADLVRDPVVKGPHAHADQDGDWVRDLRLLADVLTERPLIEPQLLRELRLADVQAGETSSQLV